MESDMSDGTDNGQGDIFDQPEENKSRRGVVLIALLLGAAVAGGAGYWTATRNVEVVVPTASEQKLAEAPKAAEAPKLAEPVKQEVAAEPAPTPAEKPAEQKVEAQASATVDVTPAPTPAPVAEAPKPAEPVVVEASKQEAAPEPQQQAALAPKATVEPAPAPKVDLAPAPKVEPAPVAVEPAIEAPSFDTVRIEPTGDAVIAGRAAAGTEVLVMLDGTQIGSVTASSDGSFAYVSDKPLPAGTAVLTLQVKQGGKVVASVDSVAVAVKDHAQGEALVAVLKPGSAPKIVQAPSTNTAKVPAGTVALDSVDYDKDGNIVFAGRGAKSGIVRVYVDNALAGEVLTSQDGKWTFSGGQAVVPGKHVLRADELKADGTVSSRVELPFLREDVTKLAAAEPAAEQSTTAETPIVKDPTHMVIQPGNNLWRLSRKIYGKGMRYTVIWEANKDQIRNPNRIYPGQVFVMPKAN
jgi:nucleoid-associated protein YgaU